MDVVLQLEVLAEDAPIDGPGATFSTRHACSRFARHLLLHLLFVVIKVVVIGFCLQQCYVFHVVVCVRVFVLFFRRSASVPFSGRVRRRAHWFFGARIVARVVLWRARASSRALVF